MQQDFVVQSISAARYRWHHMVDICFRHVVNDDPALRAFSALPPQ